MVSYLVKQSSLRTMFSRALSDMYAKEVPLYGKFLNIVDARNKEVVSEKQGFLEKQGLSLSRISEEKHGAIRLGCAEELRGIAAMFSVMGMYPVGYYDLTERGLPVHSTAFRPIDGFELATNPFRVFTSLLRIDMLPLEIQVLAKALLSKRKIITKRLEQLIAAWQKKAGLEKKEAEEFVSEAVKTFCWHPQAKVSKTEYESLLAVSSLAADILGFQGPHINHLTPNSLDIDANHRRLGELGIDTLATIQGPPLREVPILLRQTSFLALSEDILFPSAEDAGGFVAGKHRARFGEIESRGASLTPLGRKLYDRLTSKVIEETKAFDKESVAYKKEYPNILQQVFLDFPDTLEELRRKKLVYLRYALGKQGLVSASPYGESESKMKLEVKRLLNGRPINSDSLETLIEAGLVTYTQIIYEDFLPISAAGIFSSNLDKQSGQLPKTSKNTSAKASFEAALGHTVADMFEIYAKQEAQSIAGLS